MTNFEKYKDEILRFTSHSIGDIALVNGELTDCTMTPCDDCQFFCSKHQCPTPFINWLYEEYKEPAPNLTAKERAFCEAIAFPHDKYIGRTPVGNLFIGMKDTTLISLDNTWFKFIKSDSEWDVVDLLELEVE